MRLSEKLFAGLLLTGATLAGVATAPHAEALGLPPEMAGVKPRIRMAGPPFPSPLYASVPHDRSLGEHHYIPYQRMEAPRGTPEVSRGTLYTKRGGFLDVAHLRKAVDWTAHITALIEPRLWAGETDMDLRFYEPSRYHLSFRYPPCWDSLSDSEKREIIPELALRIAQRVTYISVTWHEMLTWYGYKATRVLPERMSAFCFEDVMSHLVGITVAGEAIRDPDRAYNQAVTVALDREIQYLGKVTGPEKAKVLARVEGNWWNFAKTRKRFLNTGYPDGAVQGWLVRDPGLNAQPQPKIYTVPAPGVIHGHDFSDFLSVEIDPRVRQWADIRKHLPAHTESVIAERHFSLIMAGIKAEMEAELGPYVAVPYPSNPIPEESTYDGGRFPPGLRSGHWNKGTR